MNHKRKSLILFFCDVYGTVDGIYCADDILILQEMFSEILSHMEGLELQTIIPKKGNNNLAFINKKIESRFIGKKQIIQLKSNNKIGCKMSEKIAKLILIFGLSFLVINTIGYLFNITEFITVMNNPTGSGGRSVSNIPTILSILVTSIILIANKVNKK